MYSLLEKILMSVADDNEHVDNSRGMRMPDRRIQEQSVYAVGEQNNEKERKRTKVNFDRGVTKINELQTRKSKYSHSTVLLQG